MDQPPRDRDDLPPDDSPRNDLPPDHSQEGELEETVVRDEWGEETVVREDPALVDETAVVEEHEEEVVRKPPLIWPYLLAFLLLVLGGLGAYWYFSQEDTNTVPVVVGQLEATAEASVREAGFEPESEQAESERPSGVVVEQDPEGGTELEEGETVRLTVSSGPASGEVPDVVGEQTAEAVAAVEEAGFEANVTEVFSDKEAGTIAEQDPAAGEELEEGSTVELTASKGREPVEVPDVVGTTSSQATATLRDAGLEANLVSVPSAKASGTVLAQNPAAGVVVKAGSKVRLNVAQAPGETTTTTTTTTTTEPATTTESATTTQPSTPTPASATVPDVVGQELAAGARSFGAEGLKVTVRYVPSQEAQGTIIAQARPAGTELQSGDTVQVNVSKGATPEADASVPDVNGLRGPAARVRLDEAGFEALTITQGESGSPARTVLSQTPEGGASVPRGSLVILYVSGV